MNCIECGMQIENGVYSCEFCGTHFSEEDVELMLHIEKKRVSKRLKKELFFAILVIATIILVGGLGIKYVDSYLKQQLIVSQNNYFSMLEESLSGLEQVVAYDYDENSVNVTVSLEIWNMLSDNEKYQAAYGMQNTYTRLRHEAGVKAYNKVIIQINAENGDIVLYADSTGDITIFT